MKPCTTRHSFPLVVLLTRLFSCVVAVYAAGDKRKKLCCVRMLLWPLVAIAFVVDVRVRIITLVAFVFIVKSECAAERDCIEFFNPS